MAYGSLMDTVLSRINAISSVSEEEYDGSNEWFLIESDDLSDDELEWLIRELEQSFTTSQKRGASVTSDFRPWSRFPWGMPTKYR